MLPPSILCFALFGKVQTPAPMLAFTARIYNPPGDKRISLHQVYLSQLDGTHRRRVSGMNRDCDGVRWIGDHKLAWIEWIPGPEDSVGYRGDPNKPRKLVLFDLESRRRRVLATGEIRLSNAFPGWFTSASGKRGEGLYSKDKKSLRVTTSGLAAIPSDTDASNPNAFEDGRRWKWPGLPTVELLSESGAIVEQRMTGGGGVAGPAPVFLRNGQKHTFKIGGDVVRVLPSRSNADLSWCLTGSYAGSAGSDEWIWRLDWGTDTAKCVVDDLIDIDFQADDRYYAGVTNNKGLHSWGKKQVWARDCIAGDTETGRRWVVVGGAVHATSVSIQPKASS